MSDYDEEEELIDYSRIANKKGKKGQALKRANKSTQAIDTSRQALFECIENKGTITKQCCKGTLNMSFPYWTSISLNKGTHLHTMGFSHQGNNTLFPEEAAFLVSRNALIVTNENDEILCFQDFCEILCNEDTDGWITFDKYQVYAYLKRLGYIVTRSKLSTTTVVVKNNVQNSSIFDKISYWIYKDNKPLVWNYKYSNYRAIYSTLQIIPSSPWYKPFYNSLCKTFDWNVFKPKSNWKKKEPGKPDFQIIVKNIHETLPSLYEQNQLFSQSPTFITALVGDVEGISFLRMIGGELPDIVDIKIQVTKK